MTKKQTIFRLFAPLLIFVALFVTAFIIVPEVSAAKCGGVETSIIPACPDNSTTDITKTGVWSLLLIGINVLTALVGVAAVAGIVYGAVLYTTAGGDQGKAEKAIEVFRNVVIGIIAYALMYVGLNFIIPGGVFA